MKNQTKLIKKSHFLKKAQPGFTLIEATVVLFIIALLMLLILPNLNKQRDKAEATHRKAMVGTVQTQVDLYLNDHPGQQSVSFADLKKEDYLTEAQLEKAKQLKISIQGHEAKA
ncbi:prepilin-type N-terminal cleavage/methylation domain-containing protein [Fructobacillus sp. M1-13]|uniref:Prepilin-type N-terminal cleavage/methylation domain-containing protein n=1 Tax=Fructobacillus papyriferae TaxID=2713171 RepID=A0ABS5QPI8_9LACO|nr:competence type IV pilus major pilin ComGC [Fructobacillus papyriferae]MBS9335098.1 prepilin-type N-terminal cleavage/methylation domain-containing protein [Fructobacillus papyriferae]MCD2159416.1 prepilin-type N-terminal cleavage/methylation domain-containing protein [Fructobacillus papyriferae]